MSEPLVYIIVVNYNGWFDTITCLESVFKMRYKNYRVIVIDNGSDDDSVDNIKNWAEGRLSVYINKDNPLRHLSCTSLQKKIDLQTLSISELKGGVKHKGLNIIILDENLGFAGANNLGIITALSDEQCKYIWLLNNDTVIPEDTLSALVDFAEVTNQEGRVGIIGSKLLYYHEPNVINAVGGRYYKWIGKSQQIGINEFDKGQSYNDIDYIVGASMLVKKDFVLDTGLMSEDYFLYFEELDWAIRGHKRGWTIAQCNDSIVYHKEGSTIGSNKKHNTKTPVTDYYTHRNRILITKKFYYYCLPTVLVASVVSSILRFKRFGFSRVWLILRAIFDGLRGKVGHYEGL